MPFPEPGDLIPSFSATATQGRNFTEHSLQGKITVLYFYPRDDTPGCTTEGQDFRDHQADFAAQGAQIIGVSRDSLASHEKFCTKYALPFPLIADSEETLCQMFNVLKEKTCMDARSWAWSAAPSSSVPMGGWCVPGAR